LARTSSVSGYFLERLWNSSPHIEAHFADLSRAPLGTYAVKKIAVGTSKEYLVKMLREVRLLEALRHPNIIPYHHSWIDVTRFSR
jgi:serine/threonine protein kinase